MTASLIIAGFEVLDPSTDPQYRLAAGINFGSGQPDQAVIASVYLDGDAVSGRRTSNRTMQLPLFIDGADALVRAGFVNDLLQAVSTQTFTVQWTPDGGLPVVFDCYRASWTQPDMDMTEQHLGRAARLLTFAAKPFGRSPNPQSVSASGVSTQLDSFDTAPTGATLDTSVKYEGTASARKSLTCARYPNRFGSVDIAAWAFSATPVSRTFGAAKDITGVQALTIRVHWSPPQVKANGGAAQDWTTHMNATLTLTSAAGNVTLPTTTAGTFKTGSTAWKLFTFNTSSLGSLDVTAVTGYSLDLASDLKRDDIHTMWTIVGSTSNIWIDDLDWVPAASSLTSTTHGANLLLPEVVGSARAPVNLALTNGGTFTSFLLHTPPDDQDVDAQILTALSVGSTDQTVTVAQANAGYAGTYSLVLGVGTLGSGAVTATVTITQRENGGAVGSAKVLTSTYTAGGLHVLNVGEVTLPLYAVPADNNLTDYTIRVQATGTDRYSEVMLLDTRGQTVYTDSDLGTAVAAVYTDEPSALQSGSPVYASATDRTAAYSVLDGTVCSGGPCQLDPGANKVLAWTSSSAPSVTATYSPRWIDERVA